MANPVGSKKFFTRKELLPSLRDQEVQVRSIDGHLTMEHSKLKLTPHDMRDIKWSRLLTTSFLTNKHHVHKIGMHLVLVAHARKKRVAKDPVHDVEKRVQHIRLLLGRVFSTR